MEFTSFKRSFKTLVENKSVSAEEKIYYLQQYLVGEAKEAVAGCFYGTEEEDYVKAWTTLERRFGHSFKIQEAFRERLDNWPRINPKDNTGLQKYADFLNSCNQAMPHIKGLMVLNDCKSNQKIVSKLPDHLITRWSRRVTEHVDQNKEYPAFSELVSFVQKEARIANNPIVSFSAIKTHQNVKPSKDDKVRTLTTSANNSNGRKINVTRKTEGQKSHTVKVKECPFSKIL